VKEPTLTTEELLVMLTAVAHPLRLRVIGALADGRVHVSELARRLGMSRPLLYMHLDRLEKAGLVTGHLELSPDGKAMKFFELAPFELRVTAETIVAALRAEDAADTLDGDAGTQFDEGTRRDDVADGNHPDSEKGDQEMEEGNR
jgi:DNA-binding transcriptional ArsR family regulator